MSNIDYIPLINNYTITIFLVKKSHRYKLVYVVLPNHTDIYTLVTTIQTQFGLHTIVKNMVCARLQTSRAIINNIKQQLHNICIKCHLRLNTDHLVYESQCDNLLESYFNILYCMQRLAKYLHISDIDIQSVIKHVGTRSGIKEFMQKFTEYVVEQMKNISAEELVEVLEL